MSLLVESGGIFFAAYCTDSLGGIYRSEGN